MYIWREMWNDMFIWKDEFMWFDMFYENNITKGISQKRLLKASLNIMTYVLKFYLLDIKH